LHLKITYLENFIFNHKLFYLEWWPDRKCPVDNCIRHHPFTIVCGR